jgi:hypothetical protein
MAEPAAPRWAIWLAQVRPFEAISGSPEPETGPGARPSESGCGRLPGSACGLSSAYESW